MNLKTTLILLLILIALCAGYGLMVHLEQRAQVQQAEAKRVFSFAPDDLVAVEVQRIDEPPVAAQRKPGEPWTITKPNNTIQANQQVWDRLAKALAELANERTIDKSPSDRTQYGLDAPVLKIQASTADGASIDLTFGAAEPTQVARYACHPDGTVFLIDNKAFQELDRPLKYLRYPYVFTVGDKGITKIEYSRFWTGEQKNTGAAAAPAIGEESVKVAVDKDAEGKWRMIAPIAAPASQEFVSSLVKEIQFAVGRDYVEQPENLADYGLKPPKCQISIYTSVGSEPQTLYLGSSEAPKSKPGEEKKEGGIFAKQASRPAVFIIDANVMAVLPKMPDAFRETHLLSRPATDLVSIRYVTEQTDVLLENDPEHGWRVAKPEGVVTDQLAISNFIIFLKAVQGRGFPDVSQAQAGLDKPTLALTLTFKNEDKPAMIRVGAQMPDNSDQYYALTDTGVVALLNSLDVSGLTKTAFDFSNRTLMAFDGKDLVRLTLQIEGADYAFEKVRGQWHVREPANRGFANPNDWAALIKAIGPITAVALEADTAPADLAPYGLDAPVVTISAVTAKDGEAETVLGPVKIGKPAPNNSQQRFATMTNDARVFRVRQAIIDEIRDSLKGLH